MLLAASAIFGMQEDCQQRMQGWIYDPRTIKRRARHDQKKKKKKKKRNNATTISLCSVSEFNGSSRQPPTRHKTGPSCKVDRPIQLPDADPRLSSFIFYSFPFCAAREAFPARPFFVSLSYFPFAGSSCRCQPASQPNRLSRGLLLSI
jgi:hypothetical protein